MLGAFERFIAEYNKANAFLQSASKLGTTCCTPVEILPML
jgi:hypothetical protein